jgi:iron complex outermembrane recepter protein
MHMRNILLTAISLSALIASGTAAAQETDGNPQEIVVTGEKSERSLQDTTTSVAVTTPRRVEQENIVTLQDVYQRTANVTETYGVSGFTIRGIANRGISGGGDAALSTVYVDGAALPSSVLQAAPTDMWDVAQVEILRGPQSTLQGLNALAGAVIVNTTEPTMDWNVRARAMIADGKERQFAAALGGPIIPGELAFRVSAEKRDADGFTWNPTRKTPENPLDSTNVRAKLLWTPSFLPGFEARANYTHYDRYGGYAFSYTDITTPNFYDNRVNTSDAPNDSRANTDIASLDLRYNLGGGFSLTSVSAYNDVEEHNRYDNDMTASAAGGTYQQWTRFKTFTQEVRLNYDGDWLSGLLGGFYYDRDQTIRSISRVGVPTPVSTISALLQGNGADAATADYVANLYAAALPEIPVNYAGNAPSRVQTFAIFGDGRLKLTDQLSVLAGFRWDHEKNRVQVDQVTTFAGTYPDPANYGAPGSLLYNAIAGINLGVAGIVAQASGSAPLTNRTFNAFLPKLGLEMAWTPDIKTAFTVQRGYRSGGSSSNTARSQTFSYDPEYTWNYELSFRSAWLDGALTLNANAFYIDWRDQQTTVNFGLNLYDYHTVNAGKSHVYGFEVEATHRISSAIDWYAALGHTRTKFDEFNVTIGSFTDLSGLEFGYAPHWTLSGGVNVRPADGFNLNVNASHRSAIFSEASVPQSDTRLPSRTLVNARIGYQADHWSLSGFVNNAFDEKYMQYGVAGLDRAVLGNPRVFGAVAEVKW